MRGNAALTKGESGFSIRGRADTHRGERLLRGESGLLRGLLYSRGRAAIHGGELLIKGG